MMRWIYDVKGRFQEELKVLFVVNLIYLGEKGWWKFVTIGYSHVEQVEVTWKQYVEMFREEFIALMKRRWLDHE